MTTLLSPQPVPCRIQTVLVAEDDLSQQVLLRRAVKKAGLDVALAFVSDGWGVVKYLQQRGPANLPAALLLDLKMPGLDGFEVLEWLRNQPELRPPYVVVLSSSPSCADIARASRLGVDHYLVKPGDPVELVATLRRLEPYWIEQVQRQAAHPASDLALAV